MKITELLSDSSKYCMAYGVSRLDHDGGSVSSDSTEIATWSLYAALLTCYPTDTKAAEYHRLVLAMHPSERDYITPVTNFGGTHDYEEVLQLAKDAGV